MNGSRRAVLNLKFVCVSSGKKDLLVADGSIGSFRGASVAVRVISDLPSTCLTARHLLIPSPVVKYVNAHSLVPPVVVYVTSECKNVSVPSSLIGWWWCCCCS